MKPTISQRIQRQPTLHNPPPIANHRCFCVHSVQVDSCVFFQHVVLSTSCFPRVVSAALPAQELKFLQHFNLLQSLRQISKLWKLTVHSPIVKSKEKLLSPGIILAKFYYFNHGQCVKIILSDFKREFFYLDQVK